VDASLSRACNAQNPERWRLNQRLEWPDIDGEDRVRAAVPSRDANVLLLEYPSRGMDDYCTRYAAIGHRKLGEDLVREAVLRREHFEKMGIRGLTMTLIVIQWNAEGLYVGPATLTSLHKMRTGPPALGSTR
jgi:hypothetical protein